MPVVRTFPRLLRDDGAPKGALKTPIKGEALQSNISSGAGCSLPFSRREKGQP